MDWLDTSFIYTTTKTLLDSALDKFLSIFTEAAGDFVTPVTIAVAIYLALTGYSVMTGVVAMTPRDLAIRFSKAIGIVLLIKLFSTNGLSIFNKTWDITDEIAHYYTGRLSGLLGATGNAVNNLDALAVIFSANAEALGKIAGQAHDDSKWATYSWLIVMIPFGLLLISVYIAKFVTALLFIASPLVFILSLKFGSHNGNQILFSWFKMMATTLLAVIFVYMVGITVMYVMVKYMLVLLAAIGASMLVGGEPQINMIHLAPLGILSVFSIILMSQAQSVASGVMGIAASNTQQATSFMQIGALRAA